jgi:hypothetical protein
VAKQWAQSAYLDWLLQTSGFTCLATSFYCGVITDQLFRILPEEPGLRSFDRHADVRCRVTNAQARSTHAHKPASSKQDASQQKFNCYGSYFAQASLAELTSRILD